MSIKRIIKDLTPEPILSLYHRTLSATAAAWFRSPSKQLIVIGVTGTKGKSTTVNLIAQLLEAAGEPVGLTSTINFKIKDREWLNDKKMTMLGRFALQKLLRDMVAAGCRYAVIETSSEGIKQFRHCNIAYDIVVFTNLTPEHIEAHGSFERYRAEKEKLFQHLTRFGNKVIDGKPVKKIMVLNSDDPESERLKKFQADETILYGIERPAELRAVHATATDMGATFTVDTVAVRSPLLGIFNVYNLLAALASVVASGKDKAMTLRSTATIHPLPGRQEWINEGQEFHIMVDYAYEPESQRQLYAMLAQVPHNKIIHVTGSAGGGRDASRRTELGKLAAQNASIVIVTNEDPYDEDPQQIIEAVAAGARGSGKEKDKNLFIIGDRREAIRTALSLAEKKDLVLITGKGSEQAICIADGKKIPWDDRVVVREELARKQR